MAAELLPRGVFALPAGSDGGGHAQGALVGSDARGPARGEAASRDVAEVYETYVDYVYRCLRHLGVSDASLEDAVQDVFLVVHDKLGGFDGSAKLSTWLYAIVIRVARRYRTRRAHAVLEDAPAAHCTHAHAAANEQLALARSALAALDEGKREVFVLSEIEQMSAPEIAAITELPVNTVYSRLRAARALFNHKVQQLARARRRRAP